MCRFQKSRQKNTKTHGNAAINVSVPVFVLSGLLHRIKGVNLDESNFPMCALAIEKSLRTANRQKKIEFHCRAIRVSYFLSVHRQEKKIYRDSNFSVDFYTHKAILVSISGWPPAICICHAWAPILLFHMRFMLIYIYQDFSKPLMPKHWYINHFLPTVKNDLQSRFKKPIL